MEKLFWRFIRDESGANQPSFRMSVGCAHTTKVANRMVSEC
jgi:hypothetical protein